MSVRRTATMACDGRQGFCHSIIADYDRFVPMTDAAIRKIAKLNDWTQVDGKDYCATCSERRKAAATKEAKP